jgi:hypothetical protein
VQVGNSDLDVKLNRHHLNIESQITELQRYSSSRWFF